MVDYVVWHKNAQYNTIPDCQGITTMGMSARCTNAAHSGHYSLDAAVACLEANALQEGVLLVG